MRNEANEVTATTATPKYPILLESDMNRKGPAKARDLAARSAKGSGGACKMALDLADYYRNRRDPDPEDERYARQKEEDAILWAKLAWREGVAADWMNETGRCRKAPPWER